jgi:small subunit ribosomal protein S4
MARITGPGPVCRICRREGLKLFLKGSRCLTPKCAFERRGFAPGAHGNAGQFRRGRSSDYSLQLREKQKVKRIYGVPERQFRRYFSLAQRSRGLTGATLLQLLESRLDNVVYRLGLAESRKQARQLVAHGHFNVNGRRVDIPSAQVRPGDVITVREPARATEYFKTVRQVLGDRPAVPRWLSLDADQLQGTMVQAPTREDIELPLNEQLIVEFYSR